MIKVIRPILLAFLSSEAVKQLVVELLEAVAARTDNKLDDTAVRIIRETLIKE